MPGRQFNSGSYNYGFGGKLKDDELKGSGNSYDFGARIYDSRLGRWLSLDPLMAKYPELTPYNFTGNNPILFVDKDGRDYGVYVNHTDKTIIIKATLYASGADVKAAQASAMHWNAQNGKYQYKVGVGDEAVYYDVQFEITVVGKENSTSETERNTKFRADKSGEGNKFDVTKNTTYETPIEEGLHGKASTNEVVVLKGATEKRKTGAHEVGHALGLKHFFSGLMARGKMRADVETDVTTGNVSTILSRVGIGNACYSDCDKPEKEGEASSKAVGTVKPATGSEPADFKTGEVVEKKSTP